MPFRTDLVFSDDDFNNVTDFIGAFPELAEDTARATFQRYEPAFMAELRYTPNAPRYPIAWASDRQRRAFFATNGFGAGIPYRRTGALQRGWEAGVIVNSTGVLINVSNPSSIGRFVYGGLRQQSPQQQMHINTGWVPAYRTLVFWANTYNTAFAQDWARTLDAKAP